MNKRSGLVLRMILGGYLVFLGVSVLIQAIQTKPSDLVIKALFGVLFIVVGGFYAFTQIRKAYHFMKEETDETSGPDVDDSTQPLFETPQHDQSLFRTAPMPTEEIRKNISAQETDLRANMRHMQEKQREQAVQNENGNAVRTNEAAKKEHEVK